MGSGDPRRRKEPALRRGTDGRRGERTGPVRIEVRDGEAAPPAPLPPEPPPPVQPEQAVEAAVDGLSMEDEVTTLRDRLLRVGAEFENYRKRQARDFNRLCSQGRRDLVGELLVVLDNFDRAEEHRNGDHSTEEIVSGLTQTLQMLRTILEREGLSEIPAAVDDPFDPNIHEAMMAEDRGDLERDTVLQVLQKGYRFGTELLRPVRVKVGKAPAGNGEEEQR